MKKIIITLLVISFVISQKNFREKKATEDENGTGLIGRIINLFKDSKREEKSDRRRPPHDDGEEEEEGDDDDKRPPRPPHDEEEEEGDDKKERNEDGSCKKCTKTEDEYYEQCLSKLFGCVEAYYDENCLECDDLSDVGDCTGCMEGFELDENHNCIEIEVNQN